MSAVTRGGYSPARAGAWGALGALGLSLLAAVPAGVAWWLLAPGGWRALPADSLAAIEAPAGRDVALALCCAAAGGLLGLWWLIATALAEVKRAPNRGSRAVGRLVGLLLGGFVGGAATWLVGVSLAALDPGGPAGGLASADPTWAVLGAILLWPLVISVLVAVDTVRDLLVRP